MKQMILKKVQTKEVKRPCRGCVFSDGTGCGCGAPPQIKPDMCYIENKFSIWIFDRIEDEKTN